MSWGTSSTVTAEKSCANDGMTYQNTLAQCDMEIRGREIDKLQKHNKELHIQNWKLLQGQGKLQEEKNKLKGQIKKLPWALCNLHNQVKKKTLFLKTI